MSDDFTGMILKILAARWFEGESQIQEHIDWTPKTKGMVPLAQAATAAVGILALLVGLGMLGWGTGQVIDVEITVMDAVLVGVMVCVLLVVSLAVARWVLKTGPTVVIAGFALLVMVVMLVALTGALAGDGMAAPAVVALGLAPAFLVAGGALAYRQLQDLLDPFGKTSPAERMVAPYISQLFGSGQGEVRRLTVPYRVNGALRAPVAAAREDGEPIVEVHVDDMALAEFIDEAARRGLARRSWLVKGGQNVLLPRSGVRVGRDVFDELMGRLVAWGFVDPGGEGAAAHWLVPPGEALETLEREMVEQLGEGE